jgi:HAD superfamily phosphatase (TIGR01668 family)
MLHHLLPTKKFIPSEFHQTFFDIDFEKLYQQGFRLILCDLDNTLISYDETFPTKELLEKFTQIESFGFELILISNNVPSRLQTFVNDTNLTGFANARKPLKTGIKKAVHTSTIDQKDKIVLIGDQLLTDIWAANRYGVYSILVNPIKKKTEKWYTRMNRKTEVKMVQKIKRKYPNIFLELGLDKRK